MSESFDQSSMIVGSRLAFLTGDLCLGLPAVADMFCVPVAEVTASMRSLGLLRCHRVFEPLSQESFEALATAIGFRVLPNDASGRDPWQEMKDTLGRELRRMSVEAPERWALVDAFLADLPDVQKVVRARLTAGALGLLHGDLGMVRAEIAIVLRASHYHVQRALQSHAIERFKPYHAELREHDLHELAGKFGLPGWPESETTDGRFDRIWAARKSAARHGLLALARERAIDVAIIESFVGNLAARATAPRTLAQAVSGEAALRSREATSGVDSAHDVPLPPAVEMAPAAAGARANELVILGTEERTGQFGILGRTDSATVAMDLTHCNTVSLFGVQGFGKSYTMGVIAEMAARALPGLNELPSPLATVIFHYHKHDAYAPEYAAARQPNRTESDVERLAREYGAQPTGLDDLVILVPAGKVERRRAEYPGVDVRPIQFASSELGADAWKFLMGAVGNDALYVRQIVAIMQRYRDGLTIAALKGELEKADLTDGLRALAAARLSLAASYIDDATPLRDILRPGRTVIVDLRDEWLEEQDALGLFAVLMTIFGTATHGDQVLHKLLVFDEAHKYMSESALVSQVVNVIREMRHQAASIVIASQDPLSLPRSVLELTSILVLHRMTSPQWLRHLKGAIGPLQRVTEAEVASLQPGEALVWSQRSTDARFVARPQKITIRPRATQHGGGTRTLVARVTPARVALIRNAARPPSSDTSSKNLERTLRCSECVGGIRPGSAFCDQCYGRPLRELVSVADTGADSVAAP